MHFWLEHRKSHLNINLNLKNEKIWQTQGCGFNLDTIKTEESSAVETKHVANVYYFERSVNIVKQSNQITVSYSS